ncbi:MAG: aconitate hydratase [Parachlamydiaceae bacterium]
MPLYDLFKTIRSIKQGKFYSIPALAEQGFPLIRRLPISIRIILESLLRNCDGKRVEKEEVIRLATWNSEEPQEGDVPFIVSRVILQDFTGVPLLVDLAAMRDAVALLGQNPSLIEPQVPVDLVIDHSVQVDRARTPNAFAFNMQIEFERNRERYTFLKWGQQAFKTFQVIPPAIGIVHQVNLEHIATVVSSKQMGDETILFPDTLVGTDSHTTMINGLGVVGWGVGGIEAEAAMLGQPVSLQTPEVIGVYLKGCLLEGVTATDLTLKITEMLRNEKVVGKFVEFFGEGAASLGVADRATIANMAPEYGATMGFFPVDEKTIQYLEMTGRDPEAIALVRDYLVAQEMFGIASKGDIDFTKELELDLTTITPSVSGPKRPQDRLDLAQIKDRFHELLGAPVIAGGYGKEGDNPPPFVALHTDGSFSLLPHQSGGIEQMNSMKTKALWSEQEMVENRPFTKVVATPGYAEIISTDVLLTHGSIVIAAITSCTNTSNPAVMIAAGLLAKKAVKKGLKVNPMVKTSLAPGSRVVTDYLLKSGLQGYLDALGFELVGYGCTTCIGNSGPLDERIEEAIREYDLITASVLSGNRNFEARIHSAVKANFLMSPPLVVAFAIAGRVDINLEIDPLGYNQKGAPIYLKDIWPSDEEIQETIRKSIEPSMFRSRYAHIIEDNPMWKMIETTQGAQFKWDKISTYIQPPPYFNEFTLNTPSQSQLKDMHALAIFGDSVTTDHISPAGSFKYDSPAGQYLLSLGVKEEDFNSYGSRRGNHQVMMRGTFGNVRLRNQMADGKEGGVTKLIPDGELMPLFEACQTYEKRNVSLIVFAGKDYGMGSSRDWAAKGPALLGVKVVVAQSFERIHRSNLIGMGILPLQFLSNQSVESIGIKGNELFSLEANNGFTPKQHLFLTIQGPDQSMQRVELLSRLDTPLEIDYYLHKGILPFVLRQLLKSSCSIK